MNKVKITGKVLVIQLGREETRIVLMGKGSEILKTLQLATPADAVEDGMIRNPDAVREMLKAVLKEDPQLKRGRQVVFSLRTSQVITENVTVPDLNAAKTEKLIQSNLDTYFPVDITDYRVVWQQMGIQQDENGAKEQMVKLWAVPNAIISRYYQVANACGLSVAAIDYCGNSLATACGLSFANPAKDAKAEKKGFKLDLNMEIGGKKKKEAAAETSHTAPAATAVKSVPNTNLYVSLDKDLLGMTFSQNGQVVYQRFIRCGDDPAYQFDELAMMLEYYRTLENGRGSAIRGVVLGSLAGFETLVSELQDALGVPLGRFRGDCAPGLVFCVGAARTGLDFGVPTLNKVSTARTQMVTQLWQYGVVLAGGLALISVVMFTLSARLVWNMDISSLETTKQSLQIQAAKVAGFADNYYNYENKYNSYNADWETVFSSLRTYNDNLVLMLSELESIVPENSSVTALQIAADGMNVTFACENKEEAAYLIMALRKLQYADLLAISNLSGGGGGPATSYGSGNADEQAPSEGSNETGNNETGSENDESLKDEILKGNNAVYNFVASEITEEEILGLIETMSPEELDLLENAYGKIPGIGSDEDQDSSEQLGALAAMKEAYYGEDSTKTEEEKQIFFQARTEAMRTLLTTDPFAMNHFLDLLEEDFMRDADSLLWWVILDDVIRLEAEGKLNPGVTEDVHLMAETMDILVDVLVQDEVHLSAAEDLLCTDMYMELSYLCYLEANLGLREAESLPWLDKEQIMNDMMEGSFQTGKEELDQQLNDMISDETWEIIDSLDTEEGIRDLMEGYFGEGTTGNEYIDNIVDEFITEGTTGNEELDGLMKDFVESDQMNGLVEGMLNEYIAKGTTGVPELDQMIEDYLENGTTGNAPMDKIIENYYSEMLKNMDSDQMSELLNKYLMEGSTGNALYDRLITKYLMEGTTGNSALDDVINNYMNNIGEGGSFGGLTDEQLNEMMMKYLTTGTTGNSALDSMILKYMMTGTTGIPALDAMIMDFILNGGGSGGDKPGEDEEDKPDTGFTKEQVAEMFNKYLEDGTTGNSLYDGLIDQYLTTGTTGNDELDKLIDENLDEFFSAEKVEKLLEKYLNKGTTGNEKLDDLFEKYLDEGTTGNEKLDKMVEDCLEEYFTDEKVSELLEQYLTLGTTNSAIIDELIDKYLEEGTTGIETLDTMIKNAVDKMIMKWINTGTTGSNTIDKLLESYLMTGSSGNAKLDKLFKRYLGSTGGSGGSGGQGGLGGLGGMGGGAAQDTRIYFTVSLGYKEELKSAELARKGLYYDDKISKLEVGEE